MTVTFEGWTSQQDRNELTQKLEKLEKINSRIVSAHVSRTGGFNIGNRVCIKIETANRSLSATKRRAKVNALIVANDAFKAIKSQLHQGTTKPRRKRA